MLRARIKKSSLRELDGDMTAYNMSVSEVTLESDSINSDRCVKCP